MSSGPDLVLGPLLRHAGRDDATVWVETDRPCEVSVLGRTAMTFAVCGHHYALVRIDGLEPGEHPYEVALDGRRVWPEPGSEFPPSTIRTVGNERKLRIAFGSCRVAAPHETPYTLDPRRHELGLGVDALHDFALRIVHEPAQRPDILVLLGDQVYADELSRATLERIRARRGTAGEHGEEVADFEEYTWLYHESWGEPAVRWLLSTVPSAMIFDDHDVHDDWNISESWVREMRAEPWWEERIVGAFMSYWLYQHLGNLSLTELGEDALLAEAEATRDVAERLRAFAQDAARSPGGSRWSYRRDLGDVRLVVVDSRAGRVLEGGRRSMLDDEEWEWLAAQLTGDVDHLLVATSLPLFLLPAIHHGEAWSEAVAAGAWGRRFAAYGERIRRAGDLEHWAAFSASFAQLVELLRAVAAGERGRPPALVAVLSGDVHHSYVAEVDAGLPADGSVVVQLVSSPFRNPLGRAEQTALRIAATRGFAWLLRALARAAGVPAPTAAWRFAYGPTFANQVAVLDVDGRAATLVVDEPRRRDQRRFPLVPAAGGRPAEDRERQG